jgi:hypothetical protein
MIWGSGVAGPAALARLAAVREATATATGDLRLLILDMTGFLGVDTNANDNDSY